MKLFVTVVLAVSLSISKAVLPPEYEIKIWCPPGDCQFYTNPFGFDGPPNLYSSCYNNSTGNVTDEVLTGNVTNITAPEGWEEPEECTKEEYSECDYDNDCTATVRTMEPIDTHVWGSCACFANSIFHPFDQCVGRDDTNCVHALCEGDPCEDYIARCEIGDNGAGTCIIDHVQTESPTRRPSNN